MKSEKRIIKASIAAGITDTIIGLIMAITGWHEWYYNHFHVFGILGLGMILYGLYHLLFYKIDTGELTWLKKKHK